MNDSWFFDENFNDIPEDFFGDDIKYLDFPFENVERNGGEKDLEPKFQGLEGSSTNIPVDFWSGLSDEGSNGNPKIEKGSPVSDCGASICNSRQLSSIRHLSDDSFYGCVMPYEELPPRKEWTTAAGAFSDSIFLHHDSLDGQYSNLLRTSSPVSVLDNRSSPSSDENPATHCSKFVVPAKRPRSKCPRPKRRTFHVISTARASKSFHPLVTSESESETYSCEKMLNPSKKRKKKKNLMLLSSTSKIKKLFTQHPVETRKCAHCEITKTPQWREGPMGPKTLCNACGVRYRSGRLLPEYRPAASPTFVPTVHSNSHRKVLEMRKVQQLTPPAPKDTTLQTAPEHYLW